MFPLWMGVIKIHKNFIKKVPSPIHNFFPLYFAQSKLLKKKCFKKKHSSIEGISLFTSATGSMTVEASIVLPLFLFFFLNLGSAMEMMRLHGKLEVALWDVGNRLALYGYVLDDGENPLEGEKPDVWWNELAGVAFSYTYVKSQLMNFVGKKYLESSPLTFGAQGLQFVESDVWEGQDCFEIVVTYAVSPITDMVGFMPFRMANKYYGHIWNGYALPISEEQYVYVTETGKVYHLDLECTHLKLSVREIPFWEIYTCRNDYGQKYDACEKCAGEGMSGRVYITEEGACYHFLRGCPGLKRTVRYLPLSEAEDYRLCQRCAKSRENKE